MAKILTKRDLLMAIISIAITLSVYAQNLPQLNEQDDKLLATYELEGENRENQGLITTKDFSEYINNTLKWDKPPDEECDFAWKLGVVKSILLERWLVVESEKKNIKEQPKLKGIVDNITRNIIVNDAYKREVTDKIKEISDDEIKKYYEQNNQKFKQKPDYQIRHIFFNGKSIKDSDKEGWKQLKEKAEKALSEISSGEDFV